MRISDPSLLGPEFGQNGKENITVRNLLLHNAGFPPDPTPNYCKSIQEPTSEKVSVHGSIGVLKLLAYQRLCLYVGMVPACPLAK